MANMEFTSRQILKIIKLVKHREKQQRVNWSNVVRGLTRTYFVVSRALNVIPSYSEYHEAPNISR